MIYEINNPIDISVYLNDQVPYRTINQIKKKLSNDTTIITGTSYNYNYLIPITTLKVAGNILSVSDNGDNYGIAWNTISDLTITNADNYDTYDNFILGTILIYNNTLQSLENYYFTHKHNYSLGRVALGLKGNTIYVYCSKDNSKDSCTIKELQDIFYYELKCTSAIMINEGPHSSIITSSNQEVRSTRINCNYITIKGSGKLYKNSITLYQVYVGSFKYESSAYNLLDKIKQFNDKINSDFEYSSVVFDNNSYKIHIGTCLKKSEALRILNFLSSHKITGYVITSYQDEDDDKC